MLTVVMAFAELIAVRKARDLPRTISLHMSSPEIGKRSLKQKTMPIEDPCFAQPMFRFLSPNQVKLFEAQTSSEWFLIPAIHCI
jgi:hypothetical protein